MNDISVSKRQGRWKFDEFDDNHSLIEKFRNNHNSVMPVSSHVPSKRSAHKTWGSRRASRRVANMRGGMSRRRLWKYVN